MSLLERESSAAKSHGAAWGRGGATGQGTAARAPPGADPQLGSVRCCVRVVEVMDWGQESSEAGCPHHVAPGREYRVLCLRAQRGQHCLFGQGDIRQVSLLSRSSLNCHPTMFNVHGEVSAVAAVTAVFQGSRGCLRSCIHLTSPGRASGPVFLI